MRLGNKGEVFHVHSFPLVTPTHSPPKMFSILSPVVYTPSFLPLPATNFPPGALNIGPYLVHPLVLSPQTSLLSPSILPSFSYTLVHSSSLSGFPLPCIFPPFPPSPSHLLSAEDAVQPDVVALEYRLFVVANKLFLGR